MISSGLMISLIGIGMVFIIFIILIIAMKITAAIVAYLNKKFPEQSTESLSRSGTPGNNADRGEDAHIAIAIAAVKNITKDCSIETTGR